ncbi:MAG TPA: lactonase family protein, partial [Planctomycetaceae bacterium]|nr:lactonase family protein [Planctomycetaceae bacterium]
MKPFRSSLMLAVLSGICTVFAAESLSAEDVPNQLWVYIGSYTGAKSQGIYVSKLDLKTGSLSPAQVAAEIKNPSFLAIHPNRQFLYSISEVSDTDGKPTGGVSAFTLDRTTGKLALLNHQSSRGAGPCHIVVDPTGKTALVANYGGGSVAALPINADGTLNAAASAIQHVGSSVNPDRQMGPHAHSINVDSQSKFVFAADLGLDKVLIYRLDPAKALLTPNDPPAAIVTPGAGPRHFALLPGEKFAYVINEIGNTVTAFRYDSSKGTLTTIQEISTLPAGYKETSHTAEVVAHPSGKFIYGSNRGHDSIAIFAVDPETGMLTAKGHQPTGGKTPRNFAIDPTGAFL